MQTGGYGGVLGSACTENNNTMFGGAAEGIVNTVAIKLCDHSVIVAQVLLVVLVLLVVHLIVKYVFDYDMWEKVKEKTEPMGATIIRGQDQPYFEGYSSMVREGMGKGELSAQLALEKKRALMRDMGCGKGAELRNEIAESWAWQQRSASAKDLEGEDYKDLSTGAEGSGAEGMSSQDNALMRNAMGL